MEVCNIMKKTEIGGFTFISDSEYDIDIKMINQSKQKLQLRISVKIGHKCSPETTVIKWTYPCKEIYAQWNPALWSVHTLNPNWMPVTNPSRAAFGSPVQTHYSIDGINKITVSLNDPLTPMEITSGIIEETAEIAYKLKLFTERISPINEYSVDMVIDTRAIPYYEILSEISNEWGISQKENTASDFTKEPMYSTWYSFHQELVYDGIINQCKLAKQMGMETIIIDDGWQTNDSERGYAFCGDWNPDRIQDMKKFISDVHTIGMKCIIWYSVPFVGIHSSAWNKFEGKFLDKFDEKHPWRVVDPRYPDVREYLISIYENAVRDWDLDGLKLDFINNIQLTEYSNQYDELMDYESLEDAICSLLTEVKKRLTRIKPGIMLEFRQPYTGPLMTKCGNMLRVADCPMDLQKNRAGIIDLRLLSGSVAVHSDMLMWNYEDSPEMVALQLINIIYGVPQISMRIDKLSEEHKKVLSFYLDFWKKQKKYLLEGSLIAKNPEVGYSYVSSEISDTIIAAAYIKNTMSINKEYRSITFMNASWDDALYIINNGEEFDAVCTVYDCTGQVVSNGNINMHKGANTFAVPNSGMVCINKKNS